MSDFVMPFGKHKGRTLDQIPALYLLWCLENVDGLYPETRRALQEFLHPPDRPPPVRADGDAPPRRRRSTPQQPTPPGPDATCSICGRPGSAERPLVHERCVADEVPF